jgi:hypothetical protein
LSQPEAEANSVPMTLWILCTRWFSQSRFPCPGEGS